MRMKTFKYMLLLIVLYISSQLILSLLRDTIIDNINSDPYLLEFQRENSWKTSFYPSQSESPIYLELHYFSFTTDTSMIVNTEFIDFESKLFPIYYYLNINEKNADKPNYATSLINVKVSNDTLTFLKTVHFFKKYSYTFIGNDIKLTVIDSSSL